MTAVPTRLFLVTAIAITAVSAMLVGPHPDVDAAPSVASDTFIAGGTCLASTAPDQLDRLFETEPGNVVGADHQRTTALPNGNVLWTFQDAEVRRPDGTLTLVHNIGMIQTGSCFNVLMGGTEWDPRPWLFTNSTEPFSQWYWPLDAALGADGRMYVFLTEMVERSDSYLSEVEPTATRVAGFDIDTWNVTSLGSPANSSPALYGWSITSDDDWTYLYAHCYRQFGYDLVDIFPAHDTSCSDRVTLARVARGNVFGAPTYWTGRGWSADPARAVPVIETAGRRVNATDIVHLDGNWLAVTKVNDWFGDEIVVESAVRATGPFEVIDTITPTPKCSPSICNTYGASWITAADDELAIGLSHNRWDGAFSSVYRPTYIDVGRPGPRTAPADRCDLAHCD